jgi:16S rRNA (adenine1518-N6/adenine1519-N6)-dimethyltransferase
VGHAPRKRFGQHFLVDQGVIQGIVDAVRPQAGERLVEIGPGLGALTRPLLERLQNATRQGTATEPLLTVVEIDRDLAARWRRQSRVRVIETDVLKLDWRALQAEAAAPLRIVGNLPYNISSPILFTLLPLAEFVTDQHVMLQREVVERMVAEPGSKVYGRLSVMLQWRYRIASLLDVPPEAFDPPPQVDSAVVWMQPRPMAELGLAAPELPAFAQVLEQLVAAAFSQRRKLLRHGLGRWLEQRREACAGQANEHGPEGPWFSLQRRAEEVPVADYVRLAREVMDAGRSAAASR